MIQQRNAALAVERLQKLM